MELSCPSCGAKHNTDDFPDAFEVQCACGYSILVPDLGGLLGDLQSTGAGATGFSGTAAALDYEDEQLQVSLEDSQSEAEDLPRMPSGMTPPEELPPEMPYDPFELPNTKQIEVAQSFGSSFEVPEFEPVTDAPEGGFASGLESFQENDSIEASAEEALDLESKQIVSSSEDAGEKAPEESSTPAQRIVERAQLASMGQLLGFSYDLELLGVDSKARALARDRCLELLKDRPWLEAELRNRNVDLGQIAERESLQNLPEPLALEIYMTCLEAGGRCTFRKRETSY